jgi:hypothetical protein
MWRGLFVEEHLCNPLRGHLFIRPSLMGALDQG